MSNGRTIRVMSAALCAVALLACRTTESVSDASVIAATSPELPLAPRRVFERTAPRSALAAPTPLRPESSLEPPQPGEAPLVTVLAVPRALAVVVDDGEVRGPVADRPPRTPDSIDATRGAAATPRGAAERPAAHRLAPAETRTAAGAIVPTDRDASPMPRTDSDPTGVGDRRGERGDVAATAGEPSRNGIALADLAASGTPPAHAQGRDEAFPVSGDTETIRSVRPGDLFVVQLPGASWIFVGPTEGVEFLDRRAVASGVEFVFRLRESEDGDPVALRFESQDLAGGRRRIHTETVESTDDVGFADRGRPTDGDAFGARGSESDVAERSSAAGSALSDGGLAPDTEAMIAALESGEFDTAGVSEDRLRDMVALLGERAEHDSGVRLLEAMLGAGVAEGDWILYTLAQLLESPWEGRDVRRARGLYRRLVDEYPFSVHWDAARERIEFLNRHFFYIR